jgi:prolipoprotein diacylglyceryl transferase
MLPILQIGPLALQTPGLILLFGLWFGLTLAEKLAQAEKKVDPNTIYNLALTGLLAGIVGARLFYVARFPDIFIRDPLSLFSPNTAMLDTIGGFVTGGLAALIYGQRKNLPLWLTMDAFTPALSVLLIAFGLAHFASGDAFGMPARLPWSVRLWGEYRHPTQLYETLLAAAVALIVWPRRGVMQPAGIRFLFFIALSAFARILVESFRADSALIFGSLRTAQAVAWIIMAISLGLASTRLRQPRDGHSMEN